MKKSSRFYIPQNVEFIDEAVFEGHCRLCCAAFKPDRRRICIEPSAFWRALLLSLVLPPTVRFIGADSISGSCELSCLGIDSVSAFSNWNPAHRHNTLLAFELPLSFERLLLINLLFGSARLPETPKGKRRFALQAS
jgi:hypothetical protein